MVRPPKVSPLVRGEAGPARKPSLRTDEPPHVALIVETSMAYGRGILQGVTRYVREHVPWTVYLEQRGLGQSAPRWLRSWDGDGIISRLSPQAARAALETGIPLVDLNDQATGSALPHIQSDHRAIGQLAAEHLLERGFTQFAFLGYPAFTWSQNCLAGFAEAVEGAGYSWQEYGGTPHVSYGHHLPSWEVEVDDVARWLKGLSKPLGLMACNDFRGVQALDACRRVRIAVPEEVAVIGADDEVLACELAYPPLSSVIPNCVRIGYEAASLLDRFMKGEDRSQRLPDVAPLGIATRQSTDVTAIDDPCVAEAVRFIRQHASRGISVEDVLEHMAVSRSVLQRRFRAVLGRTIHDLIVGLRLKHVKQLLLESDLTLHAIADRSGFNHEEYLCKVFRRATGETPGEFRRRYRKLKKK